MLVYYLTFFYSKDWLPPLSLLMLALAVVSFISIARKGEFVASVILPLLAIFVLFFAPASAYRVFILTMIVYILFINVLLATSYLTFDDFFSKFFGISFGRRKFFDKTLEGSLAHGNTCLMAGYIFLRFISVPIPEHVLGAAIATLAEVLPLGTDDNFSVSLLSASMMYVVQLF